jgi:hypothetical protein
MAGDKAVEGRDVMVGSVMICSGMGTEYGGVRRNRQGHGSW